MRKSLIITFTLLLTMLLNGCQISPITRPAEPTTAAASAVSDGSRNGITSPESGTTVSGQVLIAGTAQVESFQKYELFYKEETQGDDAYLYFAGDTKPVDNGLLGIWNTDDLDPGRYSLRIRVVRLDGNYAEYYVPNLTVE